jgi:thymidylate synthase (FAD)
MKIIEQSVQLMAPYDEVSGPLAAEREMWKLEAACRTCMKSEARNEEHDLTMRDTLIRNVIRSGHHSVLEHVSLTFRVITNRGVTHEWVRHRIGVAYSQESTRYCNYGNADGGITVIWPWYLGEYCDVDGKLFSDLSDRVNMWWDAMVTAEKSYLSLLQLGATAQEARGVLPNDLKTDLVCTMNLRSLRHFFELRCSPKAHPQIRALAQDLLRQVRQLFPVVFEDFQ